MRTEILFEKSEKPSEINDGVMVWRNKNGQIHRGFFKPAIVNIEDHKAFYYVNGKEVRVENTLSASEQIKNIMKNFDFVYVHKAMVLLDWTWAFKGVPSISELRTSASKYLHEAAECFYNSNEQEEYFVGSGGFTARCDNYGMKLDFVLEEWETTIDGCL